MNKTPIILLDIDGVLNRHQGVTGAEEISFSDLGCQWPAATHRQADVYCSNSDSGLPSNGANTYRINWSTAVVDQLNDWHEFGEAEVIWLTTWRQDAADNLAPALGLSDFEVAPLIPEDLEHYHGGLRKMSTYPMWWKYYAAERYMSTGRPVVWLDDHLDRYMNYSYDEVADSLTAIATRGDHLLIAPKPHLGLQPGNLAAVQEYLSAHKA